jgi:hypothetical protein
MTTYQIAKRAYGRYEVIETGIVGWVAAETRASELQAKKQDGEYFTFRDDETPCSRPSEYCAVQAAFAYL